MIKEVDLDNDLEVSFKEFTQIMVGMLTKEDKVRLSEQEKINLDMYRDPETPKASQDVVVKEETIEAI